MNWRKKTALGVLTATLLAGGCVPALAGATNTVKIGIAFTPYKLGASTTAAIDVQLGTTNGAVPSPLTGFDVRLPANIELSTSTLGLAICTPATLLARGPQGCSPNSRIGFGSAHIAVPFGPATVQETASIESFMGPPRHEQVVILLNAEGFSPVSAQMIIPGELLSDSGSLGEHLNSIVPITPTLPGAPDASMTHLKLSLGPRRLTYYKHVHGRTVAFRPKGIELPVKCPSGGFPFSASFVFEDGSRIASHATVPCPSRHKRA